MIYFYNSVAKLKGLCREDNEASTKIVQTKKSTFTLIFKKSQEYRCLYKTETQNLIREEREMAFNYI